VALIEVAGGQQHGPRRSHAPRVREGLVGKRFSNSASWASLALCAQGALREPILYLSLYFKMNRAAYYELLNRVRSNGDWEAWLDFFLIGVRDTATQAAEAARRVVALFEQDQNKIETLGRSSASVLRVFQHLQRNPIVAIPAAAQKTGISPPR
jgi:Fic family protein